jgi:hypothetical protein
MGVTVDPEGEAAHDRYTACCQRSTELPRHVPGAFGRPTRTDDRHAWGVEQSRPTVQEEHGWRVGKLAEFARIGG